MLGWHWIIMRLNSTFQSQSIGTRIAEYFENNADKMKSYFFQQTNDITYCKKKGRHRVSNMEPSELRSDALPLSYSNIL